jgi:hypothetical protein
MLFSGSPQYQQVAEKIGARRFGSWLSDSLFSTLGRARNAYFFIDVLQMIERFNAMSGKY